MSDAVKITWLGHACFKMEYRGWSLVIDPYADGSVDGLPPLRERAEAVFCSHGHRDHCAPEVVETGGAAPPADFAVDVFPCPHDHHGGAERGMNDIHRFRFGALRAVHMGDVGSAELGEETLSALQGCELLLMPVGGHYTVGPEEAYALARRLSPRALVPMHYRSEEQGYGYPVIGVLEPFLALFPPAEITRLPGPALALTAEGPRGVCVPRLELCIS